MDRPLVVNARTLVAFVIAVAILSAGIAVAASQFAGSSDADAARRTSATVKQLKKIHRRLGTTNRKLDTLDSVYARLEQINRNIGNTDFSGTGVRRNTNKTAEEVENLCQATPGCF